MLAAVNRRSAIGAPRGSISPHCTTAYMPASGRPLSARRHGDEWSNNSPRDVLVPTLFLEIDTTNIAEAMFVDGGLLAPPPTRL